MRRILASIVWSAVAASVVIAAEQAVPSTAKESPSQFYLRYRAAVAKAVTLDDVTTFWGADLAKEFKDAPPDQRVDLAAVKRMYGKLSNVRVTKETIDGTNATLTLEGTNAADQKKVTGTAHLVSENGAWKLTEQETWQ
jgi:hypothetical protein